VSRKYKARHSYFLRKYLEEYNKNLKLKSFGNFKLWMRDYDIFSLNEVFVDKNYSILEDFLPKQGYVVLDLDAGVGDYALLSSVRVGKRGKIISIEADPSTFQILKRNIRENGLKNVIPLNIFVSSQPKQNIDYIAEKFKLKKVDLIKMDIEGEEYNAIRGAKKTIAEFKPRIVAEIHSKKLREDILKFLGEYGYKLIFEKVKKDYGFYLDYFEFKP